MSSDVALFVALLLLLGNAFFVGAEFSLVSVRRSAIEPEAAKGSKRAITTLKALENISFLMAGAQLGITLCSLALGAVSEPAIAHLLEAPFHALHLDSHWLHPAAVVIALIITVFAHVVIGEMVPKNIALATPERSALILTPILVFVVRIFGPVVNMLNLLANRILKAFDINPKAEVSSTYTRDEMADLVKESRKEGLLSEDNEHLLSGALMFDDRDVKDIVLPLNELVVVNRGVTYEQIEELSTSTGFSRFPVVDKQNKIFAYIHIKDTIGVADDERNTPIHPRLFRKLVQVHANQSIRMTLKIMQHSGAHMALVISAKQTLGLVTLEDVLEELVGEMTQQKQSQAQSTAGK